MNEFYREHIIIAVTRVLEHGDQDDQPWAFYAHDHGGLKGYEWTQENAEIERSNFVEAVIEEMEKLSGHVTADC